MSPADKSYVTGNATIMVFVMALSGILVEPSFPADQENTSTVGPPWFSQTITAAGTAISRLKQIPTSQGNVDDVALLVKKTCDELDAADNRLERKLRRPGSAKSIRLLKVRRSQIAYLRAELYYAAGVSLGAENESRRIYLTSAISKYRYLRIKYMDFPLGWMGHLGEARTHRALGEQEKAYKALAPILRIRPTRDDGAAAELLRTAKVENLEIHLMGDPLKAINEAEAWQKGGGPALKPIWQARVDWILARAWAKRAEGLKTAGNPDAKDAITKSADLVRGEAVRGLIPFHDRMALLRRLDALCEEGMMSRAELVQCGRALIAVDPPEAVSCYRRAEAIPPGLNPSEYNTLARLLWKSGDYSGTADACDALLKKAKRDDPHRGGAIQLRAAAMLKSYRTVGEGKISPGLRQRTLSAQRAVVEQSDFSADVRREALRQWVAIASRGEGGLPVCVKMLEAQRPLVKDDAYLLYAQAGGRWATLLANLPEQDDAKTRQDAKQLIEASLAAQEAAERSGEKDILARSLLLRSMILAGRPLRNPREGLKVLQEAPELLNADKSLAEAAGWVRVEMLLDMSLTDAALKAVENLQKTTQTGRSAVMLRIAEAMADRYTDQDLATRQRVVKLCNDALSGAFANEKQYIAVARRSARAMLRVGANADARALLGKLLQSPIVRKDRELFLDVTILLARALKQGGKRADARGRLRDLTKSYPRSTVVYIEWGLVEMALKQPGEAISCFRTARGLCKPGSALWCQATINLADAMRERGDTTAAMNVLRVSKALYPRFGNPELLREQKLLSEKLRKS